MISGQQSWQLQEAAMAAYFQHCVNLGCNWKYRDAILKKNIFQSLANDELIVLEWKLAGIVTDENESIQGLIVNS